MAALADTEVGKAVGSASEPEPVETVPAHHAPTASGPAASPLLAAASLADGTMAASSAADYTAAADYTPPADGTAAADYAAARGRFYAQFPHFEADIDGREYALYQTYALDAAECRLIREAASALWHLYSRVAPLLRELPDAALLGLGLPPQTLAVARVGMDGVTDTVIGRFDLARTEQGYKMLEFNADTPTFVLECFQMNGRVCDALGVSDPNAAQEQQLADAITYACHCALRQVGKSEHDPARVAFASFGASREDRGTTEYLLGLARLPSGAQASYVPIEALRVSASGLYDGQGERIDALYRLYPLEFFALDRDPRSGAAIGQMLFDLVLQNKLALINPPGAFLLQSKAVQAVLWGLAEAGAYLDNWECGLVRQYMLPTYLDPVFGQAAHVVKPVLGREGDTVAIVTPSCREQAGAQSFTHQPVVYQQYVEMPRANVMTREGIQSKCLLTSCFVLNGQPGAIGLRAGGRITDTRSLFLPVSVTASLAHAATPPLSPRPF